MGRLTSHILDLTHGCPAKGIRVDLYRCGAQRELLASMATNEDGRLDAPVLQDDQFKAGVYEIVFGAADYFRSMGVDLPHPPFLDEIVIRFGVASPEQHYHVPLLVSPYGYSTYRGS